MATTIQTDAYSISHETVGQVTLKGILRLNGLQEYAPMIDLLTMARHSTERLTLDIRGLEFLNSSGIAMLSRFVIDARNDNVSKLTILGSQSVSWQGKSLKNLQRLMPDLVLEFL